MKVQEYCIEIKKILTDVGESNWSKAFESFILELNETEDNSVYRKIISIYGGMGSFDDLVLYKDGILCKKENDDLYKLKAGLYTEISNNWV